MSRSALYVPRLALSGSCSGQEGGNAVVDISRVIGDADALRALVDDLFAPFQQLHVDLVAAVQVTTTHEVQLQRSASKQRDEASSVNVPPMASGRGASVIAGAMAGAKQLACGGITIVSTRAQDVSPLKSAKCVSRARKPAAIMKDEPKIAVCQRLVSIATSQSSLTVQTKKHTIQEGARVLLVWDWIDQVDVVLAARDAIAQLGGEVVGVSVVVATGDRVLQQLKREQVMFSCGWIPPHGAELAIRDGAQNGNCICDRSERSTSRKRKHCADSDDPPPAPVLTYYTAQYQANNPSEDRSMNIVRGDDQRIQIHAVLDGHGGSIAVDHLRRTLCQSILSAVSLSDSPDKVPEYLKETFAKCDDQLRESLEALPSDVRLTKGYCNTGACAVIALFIQSTLYVANVGDCVAVLGKTHEATGATAASQLSVEHSCKNAAEVRLVTERSKDRNPIRLSKDDQASGAGNLGVKRVAGSLSVTRAFGDFYLKCEALSPAPFKSKLPYITVEPSVSVLELDGTEKFIILASDGLWEVLTPEEAVLIVEGFDPEQTPFFSSVSSALIHAALEKAAHQEGMMLFELFALSQGAARRRIHDDITCTVIYIDQTTKAAEEDERAEDAVDPAETIEAPTSTKENNKSKTT